MGFFVVIDVNCEFVIEWVLCVWEYCCFIKDGSYLNVLYDKGMVILFFE